MGSGFYATANERLTESSIHNYRRVRSPVCLYSLQGITLLKITLPRKILKDFSTPDVFNAGNNILNPGGYRDQIIPLFGGYFKFRAVSWCMPKNPVGHIGWETKKILQFRSSKTALPAIFHNTLFKNIASFFF